MIFQKLNFAEEKYELQGLDNINNSFMNSLHVLAVFRCLLLLSRRCLLSLPPLAASFRRLSLPPLTASSRWLISLPHFAASSRYLLSLPHLAVSSRCLSLPRLAVSSRCLSPLPRLAASSSTGVPRASLSIPKPTVASIAASSASGQLR